MPKSSNSPRHARLRELLVRARKDAKLTQADVAERLGKPQSYVSKYETGERRLDIVELIDVTSELRSSLTALVEELLATGI
jgi:transcriptional regulator with XRE-family HTH domain